MRLSSPRRRNILLLFVSSIALLQNPCHAMAVTPSSQSNNCAIVGVGVLGTSLCQQLLQSKHEKLQNIHITGITKSTARHDEIRQQATRGSTTTTEQQERLELITMDQVNDVQYDNVVFCAPPSGFDDYAGAVRHAANKLWNKQGTFVFTSSGGIYGSSNGDTVTETSPPGDASSSPRIGRLLNAETAALDAGGCVLRLAGLYDLQRGAHNYWFTKQPVIAGGPDGIINLLHYDDAAGACVAALLADKNVVQSKVFLMSDGSPLTRRSICESTLQAAHYRDMDIPKFAPDDGNKGKVYDGSWSNAQLQWQPKYESFDKFMASHA